jgi:hypothetical protein
METIPKVRRRLTFGFISIVLASAVLEIKPAFAPPAGRPVEAPRLAPTKPKSEFELRKEAEATRWLQEELIRRERELRENAIRSFPDFGKQDSYSILDGQIDAEAKKALEDYLQSNATAQRIQMLSWRFTSPPKLTEIDHMLKLAQSPLPGKAELGLFLDAKTYGNSYKSIVEAWGARPRTEPPETDLLADYFSSRKGNTLIVVGHVEGDAYIFENKNGTKISVNIKQLLIKAHENGVVVIPIGCSTANAGVGIGFIREIGTDAVSSFLRSLPGENLQTADLLNGLVKIGEVRVNIRDAADLFQVQVYDGESNRPITRTRIPYGAPPSNSVSTQASSSLVQTVESNAEAARPLWRKSWLVAILTDPLTYIELWIGLLVSSWIGSKLIRRWTFERRDRQRLYRLVRFPVDLTWLAFAVLYVTLEIGIIIAGFVLAIAILYGLLGPLGLICVVGLWAYYWYPSIVQENEGGRSAKSN